MATTETITVEMLLASDKFRNELTKVVSGIKKVETGTKDASTKSSSALSSLTLAWAAVAAAVYKAIGFAREAVADAIKSDRQMRQLAQTYSGMGDQAKTMAEEIGKAFAMQDDDVAALLARLGTLLQNMGLTKAEALEMSGAMVRVGADLAHFWGKSTEEAVGAIQAALTGNGRALKQFGMDVDEASIKQHALTLGIGDGKRALTQAETAMAAMSLVTKSAGNAIGETARQWNSFEMQVQRASVALQDMKEAVGRGIIAGLSASIDEAGKKIDEVGNETTRAQGFVEALTKTLATLGQSVRIALDSVVIAFHAVSGSLGTAVVAIVMTIANMVESIALNAVTALESIVDAGRRAATALGAGSNVTKPLEDIILALDALAEQKTAKIEENWGRVTKTAKFMADNIKENAADIAAAADTIARTWGGAPAGGPMYGPAENPINGAQGAGRSVAWDAAYDWDAAQQWINEQTELYAEERQRILDEQAQKEMQRLNSQAQYWSQYLTQIGNLVAQYSDARAAKEISNIDKERDKRIAAYDAMLAAGTLTEEEYQRKRTEVEEEAEREIHKVKLRAFRAEKQGKMMSTVMAGALAVIQAFAQLGPIGGAIASLIIAGITAAQLSLINQQTMPEYAQGGIAGLNGPEVALVGERGPELIIPAGQTQQLLAGGAGGGGVTFGQGSIVLNIANGTAQNVERGVMNALKRISDDRGIRNPLSRG